MLDNSEIISTSSIIFFLDNMGRWERSPIKHLKFRESVDNITEKVLECNKIWDIKCCIRFHHESRDFHEIIICIEQQDFISVHNYFDDVKHPVNTLKQHDNSCSNKKLYKRSKFSVKQNVCKSSQ